MNCYVEGCKNPVKYCIEWLGVNQYGENPEVVAEVDVCSNISHIQYAWNLSEYVDDFGEPDNIGDAETEEDYGRDLSTFIKNIQNKFQLEFTFV